jgi:hypothetical protein
MFRKARYSRVDFLTSLQSVVLVQCTRKPPQSDTHTTSRTIAATIKGGHHESAIQCAAIRAEVASMQS